MFKNTLKRLGAIVLALAMAMSVMMVSAFAAGGSWEGSDGSAITSIAFKKTVTVEADNVKAPVGTFKFDVEPADPTTGETIDNQPVLKGKADSVSDGQVTFSADDTKDSGTPSYTKDVTLTFTPSAFTAPGIYKYTVTEVDPANDVTLDAIDGVNYDTTARTLYVYVRNASTGGYEVYGAVMYNGNTKSDTITNEYDTANLTVTKEIDGLQGDTGSKWWVTITIKGAAGEKYVDSKGAVLEIGQDGTASSRVELGDDESYTIYGLSANDKYSVSEDAANSDNYDTTYTVNGTEMSTVSEVSMGTETATGKAKDATVVITNKRDPSDIPTGVIMNIAPYVLMVALAGGIAFFFLRRRNAE